jgi:hypothetical protein
VPELMRVGPGGPGRLPQRQTQDGSMPELVWERQEDRRVAAEAVTGRQCAWDGAGKAGKRQGFPGKTPDARPGAKLRKEAAGHDEA